LDGGVKLWVWVDSMRFLLVLFEGMPLGSKYLLSVFAEGMSSGQQWVLAVLSEGKSVGYERMWASIRPL
jgi:hypothetical protein